MSSAHPNGDRAANGGPADPAVRFTEIVSFPPEVLARHGARNLDAAVAVRLPDGSRPLSTAYHGDRLLVPAGEVDQLDPDRDGDYNAALTPLGVRLLPPEDPAWREAVRKVHRDLPVAVPLVMRAGEVRDRAPDPWAALMAIRGSFGTDARAKMLGIDHLMCAASVTIEGAPYTGGGAVEGPQGSTGRFVLHTGDRNPVLVMAPRPARRQPDALPSGRRPVIAVLDTGIGTHPWLPVGDPAADPVVEVSQIFQDWLTSHEPDPVAATGALLPPLSSPYEVRDQIQHLLGLTDSHAGHGTFVTGLIHQTCPDARVLSLRILHPDGNSTESSLLLSLEWLRQRVEAALAGDPEQMVDVVSLSLGFYPETAEPADVAQVAGAIQRLTDLGVLVVAAAGNDATTRPFLPAAYGLDPAGSNGGNPLIAAIGALNASGITTAAFSNDGPWISRWAPGNALVSTVPVWQGAAGPQVVTADSGGASSRMRTSPDDDDLATGFAVWAGTSFATPVVAGLLGNALADDADVPRGTLLDRAKRALDATDEELTQRGWRLPAD